MCVNEISRAGAEFTYELYCRLGVEVEYCILWILLKSFYLFYSPLLWDIYLQKKPFQTEIYTISRVILMFQVFKVIRVKVCFEKSIPSRDISSNRHYFIFIFLIYRLFGINCCILTKNLIRVCILLEYKKDCTAPNKPVQITLIYILFR